VQDSSAPLPYGWIFMRLPPSSESKEESEHKQDDPESAAKVRVCDYLSAHGGTSHTTHDT
jgi:hypothetical protein